MKTKAIILISLIGILMCSCQQDPQPFINAYHAKNETKLNALADYLDQTSYADTPFVIQFDKGRPPLYMVLGSFSSHFNPPDSIPATIDSIINDLQVVNITKTSNKMIKYIL